MEEFWLGIAISENGAVVRHSKVMKSHDETIEWCEKTMKDESRSFVLKATHQVKRPTSPVEIVDLIPKEVPRNHQEPEEGATLTFDEPSLKPNPPREPMFKEMDNNF